MSPTRESQMRSRALTAAFITDAWRDVKLFFEVGGSLPREILERNAVRRIAQRQEQPQERKAGICRSRRFRPATRETPGGGESNRCGIQRNSTRSTRAAHSGGIVP